MDFEKDPASRAALDRLTMLLAALARSDSEGRPAVALAFSGGLDSRFLAFTAKRSGITAYLLHAAGPHVPANESATAEAFAHTLDFPLVRTEIDPLAHPEIFEAGAERCYVCKRMLFTTLGEHARALGLALLDGTNASDLTVYRPGLRAVKELGVSSPLAEAGLTKADIRAIGRMIGFPDPEQSARPCLLTRFPYGIVPERDTLAALARAEAALEALPALAGTSLRVRIPEEGRALLQVEEGKAACLPEALSLLARIAPELGEIEGLAGAVSGFFDRKSEKAISAS